MTDKMAKLGAVLGRVPGHRRFPLALALAGIVLMLPALPTGLLGDDVIQRLAQLRPAELPARILDTGFVPSDSGKLGTVLLHLFSYPQGENSPEGNFARLNSEPPLPPSGHPLPLGGGEEGGEGSGSHMVQGERADTRARDYGIAPWWANETWRASLFRPVTAFTHWLDYRLFPNTPSLMHAHSIAWYAAVIFLAATLYRKIGMFRWGDGLQPRPSGPGGLFKVESAVWVAGLAGGLLLLDKNFYFPVMYVANRGFIVSLVFGLLCLQAHLQWRTTKSGGWMWVSAVCLLLSLLSNEGGASTLAFLMACALVLEPGGWRPRVASLLPTAAVVLGWRAVYAGSGFGVRHFLLYIDPGYEPWLFLKNLGPRANGLLGGQLTGLPPELALGLNGQWQIVLAVGFAIFSLLCAIVFLPVLRRDRAARYWMAVLLLALVPAATVAPLSKNLGFVAVGAFGVIASFLVRFAAPSERAVMPGPLRAMSWFVAGWLVLAQVPGALAARIGLALASPSIPRMMARVCGFEHSPEIGERDLVVINDPAIISVMAPFDRAYRGLPLPKSIRVLVPGSTRFEVNRPDASTLILTAKEGDLFDCPALGPIHVSYGCKAANELLLGGRTWKTGDRVRCKGFMAEVLNLSPRGMPRAVAFHFGKALESDDMVWLFFDWRHRTHSPFVLPQVGGTVVIEGAG